MFMLCRADGSGGSFSVDERTSSGSRMGTLSKSHHMRRLAVRAL